MMGLFSPFRDRNYDRCFHFSPFLSDPARRSTLCLKVSLVVLHVVYVGVIFLFDKDLVDKFRNERWYIVSYLSLLAATLAQYFFTAGSSPGFVLDAMKDYNEQDLLVRTSTTSKQPASSKNGNVVITIDRNQLERNLLGSNETNWTKLVMGMYPSGTSVRTITCTYCEVAQPPRAKHCHDCDKCVLQFDHHCVWLGTCIGQGNHCRFWWYICEETALSLWTGLLYITYLKANMSKSWWVDIIMITLLGVLGICLIFLLLLMLFHSYLVMTNQTTYELVRRRRIPYMRGIPERVYPFSKGLCRNIYNFCCARTHIYRLEQLPSTLEIEEKSQPYTCLDVISCRCCC